MKLTNSHRIIGYLLHEASEDFTSYDVDMSGRRIALVVGVSCLVISIAYVEFIRNRVV